MSHVGPQEFTGQHICAYPREILDARKCSGGIGLGCNDHLRHVKCRQREILPNKISNTIITLLGSQPFSTPITSFDVSTRCARKDQTALEQS